MAPRRILLIAAFALLAVAALRDFARLGDALPYKRLYDFQDFYCAGRALDLRADPYRYEPLHTCEHEVNRSAAYRSDPARVIPAPLPPYDLPPFAAVARLQFATARVLDAIAIVVALLAVVAGLAALGIRADVAALALLLPAGYLLLDAGQIVPFALLALVFGGIALARRRDGTAGVLAALTLIEPHLGLPAFAAVLLFVPAARAAAIVTAVLLAAIGFAVVGGHGAVEYVARVLPAQAAAESGYVYQYSLTYLLTSAGLAPGIALALGDLGYVTAAGVGIWLAARLQPVLGKRELVAYLPAACAVIGGAYVHMIDLAIALPAALVLATSLRGNAKLLASLALCLLAVPWIAVWISKKLFLASMFVVAALLWRLRVAIPVAVVTFGAVALTIYAFELVPPAAFAATTPPVAAPDALAQTAWAAYVAQLGSGSFAWLAIKVPTWAALIALLVASFQSCRAITAR